MLVKGTRIIEGDEGLAFNEIESCFKSILLNRRYERIRFPTIVKPDIWFDRSGKEIEDQMWTFKDKGGRDCSLAPEYTAIVQKQWDEHWSKNKKKPYRIWYLEKCFRYERPQEGRYREFTQLGVEILGPDPASYQDEAIELLRLGLDISGIKYDFNDKVERGLSYYRANGFEASVEALGAQKQIAGGGAYQQGCGWAVGVDRAALALTKQMQKTDQ